MFRLRVVVTGTTSHCSIAATWELKRFRRATGRNTDRETARSFENTSTSTSSSSRGAEFFEPTTKAAVGRPEEGQRGFLGFGKSGRSMPLNPLLVLNKVEDPASKKVLMAIHKLKNNPESMQLTEDQQQEFVNAYAETRWYARLWRPFHKLNYKRMRRLQYACMFFISVCVVFMFVLVMLSYRQEMLGFAFLSEEEQAAYLRIVMGARYSEIYNLANTVLTQVDPLYVLSTEVRGQIVVREMMKLGWHERDWEADGRERHPKSAWEEGDMLHLFFWAMMWIGRTCNGTGEFYSTSFGDVDMKKTERKEAIRKEINSTVVAGPQPAKPE